MGREKHRAESLSLRKAFNEGLVRIGNEDHGKEAKRERVSAVDAEGIASLARRVLAKAT